ncbi:MAG: hypothetical protein BAJALOKI2v1_80021 [Promethearchaeota archaeon]|nr:MAG: hypothetical protein BAJALOKI2v1_80021 [Candidatus Lokiarchaeota archaeon]
MKFFKRKKEKETEEDSEVNQILAKLNESGGESSKTVSQIEKMEIIEKLENLKRKADSFRQKEDFNNAIKIADKIMRIAISFNLPNYWKEEEKFINEISQRVQKEHLITKIKEYARWLLKQYDKLVESNAIFQAHQMVESFKQTYEDLSFFESIPEAQEIIKKDTKEWLKYKSSH